MKVNVDFSKSESKPIPDQGLYNGKVSSMELKESESSGKMYFEFVFVIQGGEFDGYRLYNRNFLNAKDNNWHLKNTLDSLGYVVSGITEIDTDEIVGRSCKLQVTHREYNNKVVADVSGIYPLEDSDSSPIDEVPW